MNFKKFYKIYIIWGIISLLVGGGIFLGFVLAGRPLLDGPSFAGIILICSAGLIYVTREGLFDIFSYSFKQLGSMMFAKQANQYNDFSEFKNDQKAKREKKSRYYVVILGVGILYLITYLVMEIFVR